MAVVFVHGIYAHDARYSEPLRINIADALPQELRPHVKFTTIFWGDVVRNRTNGYLVSAMEQSRISRTGYRRLVVEGLGDAAAYQKTRSRANSAYYEIQEAITWNLKEADSPQDPGRPLIFVAHSLGSHIVSSYAWDVSRLLQLDEQELMEWDAESRSLAAELKASSPFRRLATFAGLVTLGSNMPLFTFMFGPERVYPITTYPGNRRRPAFPGTELPEDLRAKARWVNIYSPNDLLGYPLKPLNTAYRRDVRISDHEIHVEGKWRARLLPSALNALRAHTNYWADRQVARMVADLVAEVASSSPEPVPLWT